MLFPALDGEIARRIREKTRTAEFLSSRGLYYGHNAIATLPWNLSGSDAETNGEDAAATSRCTFPPCIPRYCAQQGSRIGSPLRHLSHFLKHIFTQGLSDAHLYDFNFKIYIYIYLLFLIFLLMKVPFGTRALIRTTKDSREQFIILINHQVRIPILQENCHYHFNMWLVGICETISASASSIFIQMRNNSADTCTTSCRTIHLTTHTHVRIPTPRPHYLPTDIHIYTRACVHMRQDKSLPRDAKQHQNLYRNDKTWIAITTGIPLVAARAFRWRTENAG